MKRLFPLLLTLLLLVNGCLYREELFSRADIGPSDVPVVATADPETSLIITATNPKIGVAFTTRMDTESVEDGFQVTYAGTVLDRTRGWFDWFDNERAFVFYPFFPYDEFPVNSAVFVTIDGSAETRKELALIEDHQWSFHISAGAVSDSTQPSASLTQPLPAETDVDVYISIIITFNEPVLKCTAEASFLVRSSDWSDRRTAEHGQFSWTTTSMMTYFPDEPLRYSSQYYVSLNNLFPCRDLAGNELASPFEWNFQTMN